MRNIMIAAAAATLLASSAGAVSFVSVDLDPGKAVNESYVVTFDGPNAAGYDWSAGNIATATGSVSSVYATPAGNASAFGYVSSALSPNFATLSTPNLKSISFYWGSIDDYNSLDVLGPGNSILTTITGSMVSIANGNQTLPDTNRRIFITAGPDEVITGLTFRSTGVAFEFDDIAASAVPEPATWAMLIAGFGLVGFAARRRRSTDAIAA
jgi:hypothetical protein